ncbi:MAG TPA: D-Ala-D-Ala carboxypeptidase family metallohydrolase [Acidobacteriota bacterium]|nr:D-Ala-D-Ala carboxypeptidase family metallohydrolase [Acidobacteriota bacterium]
MSQSFFSPVTTRIFRPLLIAAVLAGASSLTLVASAWQEAPPSSKVLAGTYYDTENFDASLMLNNKGPGTLQVDITLRSLSREQFRLESIYIEGADEIPLKPLVSEAGPAFGKGQLELNHSGKRLELGAQIVMKDQRHARHFYEQLIDPTTNFASSRLEGLWWLPSPNSEFALVLANRRPDPLTVELEMTGIGGTHELSEQISLKPHQVQVLDLSKKRQRRLAQAGAISLSHSGEAGDLLARGMIAGPARGSSFQVEFNDPAIHSSTTLHGTGLRLDPSPGKKIRPVMLVHNTGDEPVNLQASLHLTDPQGNARHLPLPSTRLLPKEITDLGPAALETINQLDLRPNGGTAGVEINHDGFPQHIVASVFSATPDGSHVSQVPILDPETLSSSAGGVPWTVDEQTDTLVHFKNTTGQRQQFVFHVLHSQGIFTSGIQLLAPNESRRVDMRRLRDEPPAHFFGNPPAQEETGGQVLWSARNPDGIVLIARAEYIDLEQGTSRTYSCTNCCPDSFHAGYVQPGTAGIQVGEQTTLRAWEETINCYEAICGPFEVTTAQWQSSNTFIASVEQFNGTTTGEGAGSATITAEWTACTFEEGELLCNPNCPSFFASAFVQVSQPSCDVSVTQPPSSLMFLSTNTIQAAAEKSPSSCQDVITWTVTAQVGDIKNVSPSNQQGPNLSFQPDPMHKPYLAGSSCSSPGNGSCQASDPLTFQITAAITGGSDSVQITQDEKNIIRQEYVNHALDVPTRNQLVSPSSTTNFSVSEVLQFTVYSRILGNPAGLAQQVRDKFNELIYDDVQATGVGTQNLDPMTAVVTAGAEFNEVGKLLKTEPCHESQNPECDDVLNQAGDAILAGPNGIAETTARDETTNFGLILTSAWRNPERNEAIGGTKNSRHQFGDAVDLTFTSTRPMDYSLPELYCALEAAGDMVADVSIPEDGGTQRACNDMSVDHVHVHNN